MEPLPEKPARQAMEAAVHHAMEVQQQHPQAGLHLTFPSQDIPQGKLIRLLLPIRKPGRVNMALKFPLKTLPETY